MDCGRGPGPHLLTPTAVGEHRPGRPTPRRDSGAGSAEAILGRRVAAGDLDEETYRSMCATIRSARAGGRAGDGDPVDDLAEAIEESEWRDAWRVCRVAPSVEPGRCENVDMVDGDVDPRYSLANERTFLAWIRTSLGLLAVSAGLVAIDLPWPAFAERGLAVLLAAAAAASAMIAWDRWKKVEAAISDGRPAPPPRAHAVLAVVVGIASILVIALVLT
jgi:putative membrane protein